MKLNAFRITLALILWTAATSCAAASVTVAQVAPTVQTEPLASWIPAIDRFADTIAAQVVEDGVGSIATAVMYRDQVVWANAFGLADADRDVSATVNTIYRTGSISKTVTAVVLMQLVEQGIVDLDDPAVRYLPEIAQLDGLGDPEEITLRRLASHTAGIDREPQLENAAAGPIALWEAKVIESIPTTGIRHPAGSRYAYSNIGFGMLGLTLSRAAGRPFMDLVREHIFAPLDMRRSEFVVPSHLLQDVSVGYANGRPGVIDREQPAREHAGRGYKVPNGGVYSTVGDLARFVAGLLGTSSTEVLSERSRLEMQRLQTPGDTTPGYGLGLFVRESDTGVRMVGHSGSVAGYSAHILFDPDNQFGVVLLRNYNRGGTNLGGAAARLLDELAALHRVVQ